MIGMQCDTALTYGAPHSADIECPASRCDTPPTAFVRTGNPCRGFIASTRPAVSDRSNMLTRSIGVLRGSVQDGVTRERDGAGRANPLHHG